MSLVERLGEESRWESALVSILVDQAPSIPENLKGFLASALPILTVLGIFFTMPVFLLMLGFGALLGPLLFFGEQTSKIVWHSILLMGIKLSLMLLAWSGLYNRKIRGWRFLLYSVIFGFLCSLGDGSELSVSALLWMSFQLYALFQIRAMYTE
mmetsp:Transcript_46888/g.92291  ORF Transcript_46888/g.92291 Transcript_46888/m.92291 type:complete len:154 (-) Transcript_46888:127-588(-)